MTKPAEALFAIFLAIKFLQSQCFSENLPYEPRISKTSRCGKLEVYRGCEWVCASDCPRVVRHQECKMVHCVSGCYCRPGKVRLDRGSYCIRPHLCVMHSTTKELWGKKNKPNKPGNHFQPATPEKRGKPSKLNKLKQHKLSRPHKPIKHHVPIRPHKIGRPHKQSKPHRPEKPHMSNKELEVSLDLLNISPDFNYEDDTLDIETEVSTTTLTSVTDTGDNKTKMLRILRKFYKLFQ